MIKEKIKARIDKIKESTTKYIESHSDDIVDIGIMVGAVIIGGGVAINWLGKIVPSRTNLHVYIHLQ